MTSEPLKEMYKTPLAQVRGVFLCENLAAEPTSVLTAGITQEGWGTDVTLGDTDANGDLWLGY
jgi:hypothetical protein